MLTPSTQTLSALAVACLLSASALAASCGDCDGDGQSGILDALFTAQYTLGLEPIPGEHQACNLSGDDQLDIMDVLLLARNAVGAGSVPASDLVCTPVDLTVEVSPLTNGTIPGHASVTGATVIEFGIASPLFLDTSTTVEFALENGIWQPATPSPNQPVDQRLPTTSAQQVRFFSWESGHDLAGETLLQTTTILVRVNSFVYEDVTFIDENGITQTVTTRTPAGSLLQIFRP